MCVNAHVVLWHLRCVFFSSLDSLARFTKIYNLNHSVRSKRANQTYTHNIRFGYLINIYRVYDFLCAVPDCVRSFCFAFGWTNIAVSMLHLEYMIIRSTHSLFMLLSTLILVLFFLLLSVFELTLCRRVCLRATVCVFANHVFPISFGCFLILFLCYLSIENQCQIPYRSEKCRMIQVANKLC